MKILHTADWHIGQFKGPVVDGVNLRSQDTVNCLNYMIKVAEEEKPDIVCVSGDVFHQEQIGPVRYSDEMIVATDTITKLAGVAKAVIVMRGTPNHDGGGQFRVLSKMFANTGNVHIVTSPTVLRTPYADIACIPGFDKQEFRSRFPGLSADEENEAWTSYISSMVMGLRAECHNTSILMAHYTVPGCNMESGQTSFFTNFEPVIPREALEAAGYEAVLLGHIHRPQQINGLHNVYYSGAINAMNFNDEYQNRGFYIHEFMGGEMTSSQFRKTPYRRFKTIDWDTNQVSDYIENRDAYALVTNISRDISDMIVRVKYSCTSEQKKLLNIPLLQKDLYDWGAFYVSDIEAENAIDVTNRGLLSEESDPTLNLKKYLEEKCFKNPDKIVELAEPIIAEAMKQSTTAEIHGVFRPISIAVRNYRNYKEENFDFSDISFCTINGVNGAGKSSLFMDAIVDCLFEETREGDCKAWIRGTEDARSGSIEFIFDIGEKRFRVVRTRTKSGKPTLNLSQYQEESADWMNLSKERIIDTQAEIEKLLGMDSMTFRSCALIMQDQYGLFLQAKKDERIAILGNLLGLGIYGVMELDARKKLADARKELASKKEAVRIKTDFIKAQGNPEEELETVEKDIHKKQEELENLDESRRKLLERQEKISEAEKESEKARSELKECSEECSAMEHDLEYSKQTLTACNNLLEMADVIREKAKQHSELSLQLSDVEKDVIKYKNAKETLNGYIEEADRYQRLIDKSKFRNDQIRNQISQLAFNVPDDLEERLDALVKEREEIECQQEKRYRYSTAQNELHEVDSSYSQKISGAENRRDYRQKRIAEIRQQEEFMKNSGCPDIESASCRFLSKAVEDVKSLPVELDNLKKCEEEIEILTSERDKKIADKQEEIERIGYDPKRLAILTASVTELSKYERMKKAVEENKLEIARLETEKESNDKNIGQCEENLLQVKLKASEITETVNKLSESVDRQEQIKQQMVHLQTYVEQEKELPVYEERKQHVLERIESMEKEREKLTDRKFILSSQLTGMDTMLEKMKETFSTDMVKETDRQIRSNKETLGELQIQKGVLLERLENIDTMRGEISTLNNGIAVAAGRADCYEALKQAFSQDGVPHQIIRNIIPHITDTTNNILGQMTGGTMGVEFAMERTVKGKDGDKATLDVLINEYGKTTLPYASKSGGEKVKASLAVILALSEIKATAAGIQLGMLFIDEPPFLDDEGAQAYVDALETIRDRYSDVKIMAITHDDAMKARFGQAVTVIKTDDGSKVIY
ncbi:MULTISPECIES: metallophosphoesterase [Blautia]|uniref:metallophosphoesterase n=1 Tax=Blautia TaxID=572511 RepID=UPI001D068CC1|nr:MULTISPECIES: AAA family ATPase [Blautia]MCB6354738.1 AAA family ATPase [Blautia wexlerae]MCB8627000.1 AAA family ATPase [Blautia sp. DFI.6.71]MCB8723555.1 AAA family ATPase [Blautia sp. DFI.1.216]MED9824166.1 AAA family ATPase [Blautia faecis]